MTTCKCPTRRTISFSIKVDLSWETTLPTKLINVWWIKCFDPQTINEILNYLAKVRFPGRRDLKLLLGSIARYRLSNFRKFLSIFKKIAHNKARYQFFYFSFYFILTYIPYKNCQIEMLAKNEIKKNSIVDISQTKRDIDFFYSSFSLYFDV